VLDQLLGAAMQQADMRVDTLDDFAVQLHDHAQHAVRGRVLGTEVDGVVGDDLIAGGRRFFQDKTGHLASPCAFSSPGSTYSAPSHGLMKSNWRRSWASDRLIDHALLFLRVAQLDIAGQREILAERMPSKP
jgi:hypothetical protein